MPSRESVLPADVRTGSLHAKISRQAYALWESYGRPEGRDVPIWLEAERQVLGADPQVNQQSGAVSAPALAATLTPQRPPAATPEGRTVPPERPRSGEFPRGTA